MDHPPGKNTESHDTAQNKEMENLDENPIQKSETQAGEKIDESKEVKPDSGKTSNGQEIDLQSSYKDDKYSTEEMSTQDIPTEDKTVKNQDTDKENIDTEKFQVVEKKNAEVEEEQTETGIKEKLTIVEKDDEDDSKNKSIPEDIEDNRKKVKDTLCTADITTDTNTVIIDLCDDDEIEIYDQTDNENILAGNKNLRSNNKCDSSNRAAPGKIEGSFEKEGENMTTTDRNKPTVDPIIIDLCDDDQTETDEQNVCSAQGYTSTLMPRGITIKISKTGPIRIIDSITCDDSETEMENAIKKAESETFELTDEDIPEEACEFINENKHKETCDLTDKYCESTDKEKPKEASELTKGDKPKKDCELSAEGKLKEADEFIDEHKSKEVCGLTDEDKSKEDDELIKEDKPKQAGELAEKDKSNEPEDLTDENKEACQSTGKDLSEAPCKSLSACHAEGMDPNDCNVTKDVNLTEGNNESDRDSLEKVSVNTEKTGGASVTKDNSDEIDRKTKIDDDLENFRFKDDIITLQEDYGLDPKQINNESSENFEKSDIVSEKANLNILEECDSEQKHCETSKHIQDCGREGNNEITSNLITEENESGENNDHDPDLKTEVNEQEDIKLILIKKEIEDNLKQYGFIEKKENIASATEKLENSPLLCEATQEQDQSEENVQMPSTFEFSRVSTKDTEGGLLSKNSDELTGTENIKLESERHEKSTGTNDGGIVESYTKKLQLIINFDIFKSQNMVNPNEIQRSAPKETDSKVCQTDNSEYDNTSLSGAYLNETPTSQSDSNEEFFDAVEYIPEDTATQETSSTIKPSTPLLTSRVKLINEPVPGPSGLSNKKNREEIPVLQPIEEKEEDYKEATEFSSDEETKLAEKDKDISAEKCSQTDDILKKKESRKHDDMEDDDENRIQKKKIKLD